MPLEHLKGYYKKTLCWQIHVFMYLATRFVYYIFTVHIFKPYSHLTKFFYQQTFNTILKLTGAYIMSLKATKSKQQCMNDKN